MRPDATNLTLSIIIPVYNVEPYLEECLAGVVGQSLDPARCEILLIDDRSTDKSLDICRDFAARHASIRLFPLPENTPGGAGFPSNLGIRNARGKYVGFVDSDDIPAPDMFAELVAAAEAACPGGADLTFCGFTQLYPDGPALPYEAAFWRGLFTPAFDALSLADQKDAYLRLSPAPWRKLHKREFLRRHGIFFPAGDFFYEDMPFHWQTVLLAASIARREKSLVAHREKRPGQTVDADRGAMALQIAGHIAGVRRFLLSKNLYAAYRKAFLDFSLSMIAYVPKDHPLREQVAATITAICSAPPEEHFDDFLGVL
jgi:glycosyltransferase involved in cell wall biosynthesis